MADKFQVSVADVVLRDASTYEAIAHGKTNTTTSLTQTMSAVEARGGVGNQLLYTYATDRAVEFSIEMPTFNTWMLALQSGVDLGTDNYSVVATECLVLNSGSGQLDNTPTGDVTFFYDDTGASVLTTPTGSNITLGATGADRKGYAVYDYVTAADQITVEGNTQPSVVQLVMTAPVYDQDHTTVVQYFQVVVPQFKLDGNYSLSMTANDISKQTLNGKALLASSADCTDGDYYYKATYINVDSSTSPYTVIAATPSPMSFSATTGSATQQISVLGYRGPIHSTTSITDDCVYTLTTGSWCASGSPCVATGSATGLVTVTGSAMADGDDAVIGVVYWDITSGSLYDNVYVTITA